MSEEQTKEEILKTILTEEEKVTSDQAPVQTLSEQDPEEVAAMMINVYAPKLKEAVKTLSMGEARRLILAICTYPLENEHVMDHDNKVQQMYRLACSLLEAKTLLMQSALIRKIEENTKKEEEANGKETS